MVGLSATGAVNDLILTNKELAIGIASGLAAVGGTLTLREIFRSIGLRDNSLDRNQNLEVDLLDEQAPYGFWQRAVQGVHAGLIAEKMTNGSITPRFRWLRGLWTVDHGLNVGSEIEPVQLVDLTTVNTLILDETSGTLK
jgi:hypothetical protein